MKPLVSVLIPAYQAAAYLPRCLDSALGQTYPNLEICLADDGSTDGTAGIARAYAGNGSVPVSIRELPHMGVSRARQELLDMARGEYLFFLDADDYIDPRAIRQDLRDNQG